MLDLAPPRASSNRSRSPRATKSRRCNCGGCKETLRHAYENVAALHARRSTPRASHPDDCKTLADLAKFPFTTKSDLRDTYPFGMFAVPREQVARIHASSGTTGKPTVVGYTQGDIDVWAEPGGALDPRLGRAARHDRAMSPTATAYSPAASARTTAPSGSAARSFRSRAA